MSTVPKLNYTNLRGKSKSKDSQNSQRKIESSSDLFSHMNQDNLKYIQSQIKQKNKKNQISLRKKSQQQKQTMDHNLTRSYPQKIQQKQSKLEQTERQNHFQDHLNQQIKVSKSQSSNFKLIADEESAPEENVVIDIKNSQQGQTNKLSYYDLVSQAKSKRVSSIQNYYDEENQANSVKPGSFLNFLQSYVQQLNSKQVKKKKTVSMTKKHKIQPQKHTIQISSTSQKDILKKIIAKQQVKNMYLAKQIQKHRNQEQNQKKRIEKLQEVVSRLSEQLEVLRIEIRNQYKKNTVQNKYNNSNHTNFTLNEQKGDLGRLSHRKNLTTFSLLTNQTGINNYSNEINNNVGNGNGMKINLNGANLGNEGIHLYPQYGVNSQGINSGYQANNGMSSGVGNGHNFSYSHSQQNTNSNSNYNSRKSFHSHLQIQQIKDLQRQFKKFMETGQCQLHSLHQFRDYD